MLSITPLNVTSDRPLSPPTFAGVTELAAAAQALRRMPIKMIAARKNLIAFIVYLSYKFELISSE
jgi:hypothetical protein